MKIALVILHADPARGGAERYTIDLAAALSDRGQDVWLVHSAWIAQGYTVEHKPGSRYRHVRLKSGGITREVRYRRFLRSLELLVEDQEFDIVHSMLPVRRCNVYQPHAGIAAENLWFGHRKSAGRVNRIGNWISNRFSPQRNKLAAVESELLTGPRCPLVVCLSDQQKQTVLGHYPGLEPRLVKLFNAVDLNKFDPSARPESRAQIREQLGVTDDQVLALLISQNWELKGVRQAIEALSRLEDRRLTLAVVGKDNPRPYQAVARTLGVANRVHFPGPTNDAPAFYRAADFFVLPTRSDVCSLVVLEALAMGLPVISTAANGACEIMTEGEHGFVLPQADDVDVLAQSMRKMLDPQLRSRISTACLALRSNLSYEHHLNCLIEIYQRVARVSVA
jgi:UDP-glucose:(heptosyl)LPS alpha-1,3-glucosyltransferase